MIVMTKKSQDAEFVGIEQAARLFGSPEYELGVSARDCRACLFGEIQAAAQISLEKGNCTDGISGTQEYMNRELTS